MNWKDNVIVYDQLQEISNSISSGYSILVYKFPNHPLAMEWGSKATTWNDYWHNLKDLSLCSEEEANKEIAQLNDCLRELKTTQGQIYFLQ